MAKYERLSAQDASFLHMERPGSPMSVGSVAIFRGESLFDETGHFRIEDVRRLMLSRLHLVPRFRKRLLWGPLGEGWFPWEPLGHKRPVWVDDPTFDISYHVRLTAVPSPGREEELKTLVARVISQPLDRSKPLWEIWFVEGLEGGRTALIEKTHHSLVDGIASIDRWTVLLDTTPEPAQIEPAPWHPQPHPSPLELLAENATQRTVQLLDIPRGLARLALDPRAAAGRVTELARGLSTFVQRDMMAPATSLNRPIGLHRKVDWVQIPLEEIKETKRSLGGTVNDVILAAVAGALRTLLTSRGETLEDQKLRAFVPVSVRDESQRHQLGNRVSAMFVPLPVNEPDPVGRLRAIQSAVGDLKERKQAVGAEFLMGLSEYAVPTLFALGARLSHRQRLYNLLVTNVPGPQTPLYCLGAELVEWYGFAPLAGTQTLCVGIISYCGQVNIGINADRDTCPDVSVFAEAVEKSFVELRNAARHAA